MIIVIITDKNNDNTATTTTTTDDDIMVIRSTWRITLKSSLSNGDACQHNLLGGYHKGKDDNKGYPNRQGNWDNLNNQSKNSWIRFRIRNATKI